MSVKLAIKTPLRIGVNGSPLRIRDFIKYLWYNRGDYLEIGAWRFKTNYGVMYLREARNWGYYLALGVKGFKVLSIGGGCGEDAKFFLENGAASVHVIEANPDCLPYLEYNSKVDPRLTYELRPYAPFDLLKDYDLIKIDVEGYEAPLIPYLKNINKRIVMEAHNNFIADAFKERGFIQITKCEVDKDIYGPVVQLYRDVQ